MSLSFKDLTKLITKCCSADSKSSDDILSRFGFSVDIAKLENIFKQKRNYLHVIGLNKVLESRIPTVEDYQMISEYAYGTRLDTILNGRSQICTFMIYSKLNTDGVGEMYSEKIAYTDKKLFDCCNDKDKIDPGVVECLINNFPVYRVLVVKVFNHVDEKFDYTVYLRSNRYMMDYNKFLNENPNYIEQMNAQEDKEIKEEAARAAAEALIKETAEKTE